MYVIVLKSRFTDEIFSVAMTLSKEPRRFPDYAIAERTAHEMNVREELTDHGIEWTVKEDDGIYWSIDGEEI